MIVKINPHGSDEFIAPPCNRKINILYEDESLLVIDKPSGLLSLRGKNPLNFDSVHSRMAQQYPSVTMIHRLDFGTSGLMLLALDKSVNAHLTKQFQSRSIIKRYIAVLYGHLTQDEGLIDLPITRGHFPRQKICYDRGKASQSHYQVVDRFTHNVTGCPLTKVVFTPKTGRTHQLRIHSREIGHPIIGCDLYGSVSRGVNTTSLSERLCLHASHLAFEHPCRDEASGKGAMVFDSISEF